MFPKSDYSSKPKSMDVKPKSIDVLPNVYEFGRYSDLRIVCQESSYLVHKAIVCPQSDFFDSACKHPFREAETGIIDLSEDDPEAVYHMIFYFYHSDYSSYQSGHPQNVSIDSQCLSLNYANSRKRSKSSASVTGHKRLQSTVVEDPLLAIAASCNHPSESLIWELGPSSANEMLNLEDTLLKSCLKASLPSSSSSLISSQDEDQIQAKTPMASGNTELESNDINLSLHCKIYSIAEQYSIQSLKQLSKKKFGAQIQLHWSSDEFSEALREVYESTVSEDRGLRDIMIGAFRRYPELVRNVKVKNAVLDTPQLAWELVCVGWGLPLDHLRR